MPLFRARRAHGRLTAVARQIEGVAALEQLQALDLSHNAIADLDEGAFHPRTPRPRPAVAAY